MLNYKTRQVTKIGEVVDVYLGKRKTGSIYRVVGGFQYQISKKHQGEVFSTLAEVKRSLETD